MTTESKLSAAPLGAFKASLREHLEKTLSTPTPASEEVQRLLTDLDKASASLDPASLQEVRSALVNIQQQHRSQRSIQLAQAICEIANELGIMIQASGKLKRSGSKARPRYTPDQCRAITKQLIETVKAQPDSGLSKAELVQQLGLTANQIKRILQWPEVQEHVAGIGTARNRRYVLKAANQSPVQGGE